MTDYRNVPAYRTLRRHGLRARYALSVARRAERARDLGLSLYNDDHPVTIDGDDYTVTVEADPEPWAAFDDDAHGEVIDRYHHRDYIGGEWGGDRADGDTILALDRATAYRVDKAAESVTALAKWRHREGMARGVAVETARAELIDAGRAMTRDDPEVYVVTVTDADGHSASLYGIEMPDHHPADRLCSIAYLLDVVEDLAADLAFDRREREDAAARARAERGDAIAARFPHLPVLVTR